MKYTLDWNEYAKKAREAVAEGCVLIKNEDSALPISKKAKEMVYKRDEGSCIFCGAPGLPEAHYIPRSHGGLGVPQNIVTVCRPCHDKMDNSVQRQQSISKDFIQVGMSKISFLINGIKTKQKS